MGIPLLELSGVLTLQRPRGLKWASFARGHIMDVKELTSHL